MLLLKIFSCIFIFLLLAISVFMAFKESKGSRLAAFIISIMLSVCFGYVVAS